MDQRPIGVFDSGLGGLTAVREMSAAERKQFYEKHIRNMSLVIDDDGNVSIELKRK